MSSYDPFTPEQKAELQRLSKNKTLEALFDFVKRQLYQEFCTLDSTDIDKLKSIHSSHQAVDTIRATLTAYSRPQVETVREP